MTTTATTKQDEFFNSLYTAESEEYHTLAKVKDEVIETLDDDSLQWEIKKLEGGKYILKFIILGDFWSGVCLEDVAAICKRDALCWWIADCAIFKGAVQDYKRVALSIATLH